MKEKATNAVHPSISFADPSKFIEEILDKTSALVISEVTKILFSSTPNVFKIICYNIKLTFQVKGESRQQHGQQLGALVSDSIRKLLSAELKNLAVSASKNWG